MAPDQRCSLCRNMVDAEDLFCATCGREVERPEGTAVAPAPLEQGLLGLDCRGCGASMTYDAGAQALRCAFCGSTDLARQPGTTGRERPTRRVPFAVTPEAARAAFHAWLRKGFWRPQRLQQEARLTSMVPAYVPCWAFTARTSTHWAADSSMTPPGARADWCPVGGTSEGRVEGLLVVASGSLRQQEVDALVPWHLSGAVPYEREQLEGVVVEDIGVSRRAARPHALSAIVEAERARCAAEVPGRARNVKVNVLATDMSSESVLVPVYIAAYRWHDRSFRFVLNGETAEAIGQAPVSVAKVALAVLLVAIVLGLLASHAF
jgi:LSD1 subclass zinc finger protein